jgi:hypothetical protein
MEKTTKVTKRQVLEALTAAILDGNVTLDSDIVTVEDLQEYCQTTIEQLDAKAAKAKEKAAEKKAANDELKTTVAGVLTDEFQTADAIVDRIGDAEVTKAKVVNRLAALVKEGVAVKEEVKQEDKTKKMMYKLA